MKKNWFDAWGEGWPVTGLAAIVLGFLGAVAVTVGAVAVSVFDGTDQQWLTISGILFVIITPPAFHGAMKSWFSREAADREMAARRDAYERGVEDGAKGSR